MDKQPSYKVQPSKIELFMKHTLKALHTYPLTAITPT